MKPAGNTALMKSKTLAPKLRFPAFSEPWKFEPVGLYLQKCNSRVSSDTKVPVFSSSRLGLKPQDEYYSGRRVINQGEYGVVPPGAFVYRHMSDDGQFAFNLNRFDIPIAVSKEYPVFLPNGIHPDFLNAILNYSPDFKLFAFAQKAGGTRTRLYFSKLCTWQTLIPSIDEQRKIAQILTSLDELITAESRKAEALLTYKKGLLQNLFPRAGETTPRLRFPEFQNAQEWEQQPLDNVCEILNNRRVPITSSERQPGPYPYYGASGIVDYVDSFIFDERLVLVGEDGAKWNAFEPTAFIADGKYWVNNHAHVLKPVAIVDRFLASYLTLIDVGGYVTGAAPPKLTLGKLKTIPIPVPPTRAEQVRISGCLTSLDALITASVVKLENLKWHKQGLMQALLPTTEEG